MKRIAPLLSILALFSLIAGYLFSKASFIGRAGISLFYRQYHFLKIWWQGALVIFSVLLVVLLIQYFVFQNTSKRTGRIVHGIFLATSLVGLYFTYLDFQKSLSHRLLGQQFHLGAYLFWMGWIIVCLYYLIKRKGNNNGEEKLGDTTVPVS